MNAGPPKHSPHAMTISRELKAAHGECLCAIAAASKLLYKIRRLVADLTSDRRILVESLLEQDRLALQKLTQRSLKVTSKLISGEALQQYIDQSKASTAAAQARGALVAKLRHSSVTTFAWRYRQAVATFASLCEHAIRPPAPDSYLDDLICYETLIDSEPEYAPAAEDSLERSMSRLTTRSPSRR